MLASPQSIAQLAGRGSMKIVGRACSNSPGEMKPQSLSAEGDFTEHIHLRLLKIRAEHATDWVSSGKQRCCTARVARPNPGVHTRPQTPPKEYQISFIASFPRSRGSCASDFVRPSEECGEFCREPSLRC